MDNGEEVLKLTMKWIAKLDRATALSVLTAKGIGARTAERIVNGQYAARPSTMLRKILLDLIVERKAA